MINGLGTGGAERSLAETLPVLRREGVQATVVCLFRRTEGVERNVREAGFDVRLLSSTSWLGRIRELRQVIRRERPDIVHTTIFESDMIGRLATTGLGGVRLSSLVNTSYDRARVRDANVSRLKLWGVKQVDGWTSRHLTDHFHAISHAVKDSAVQALGVDPSRIRVIERGRDPKRLGEPSPLRRSTIRGTLGIDEDAEVILNIGRQEFQKGQVDLLRAVEILAGSRPKLVLIQAGRSGHATADLESYASRPGLLDRVHILGHRDDVPDLLSAADVFAFPSRYEGLGGALIEAMALGLPVVTTEVPALLEVVEPGVSALTVRPGDPTRLASALQVLLDDEEMRTSFGTRGRQIFLERFTLDKSIRRLIHFYEEISN